ncbi:MAG: ATP synthase F1 subunit delta [Acidimicrobiales bacterium]|nr:ATP synthase F1 subunit delta [Acidimicrobiales bacterium]
MRQRVRGYADAVIEQVREAGSGRLAALAQELAAAGDVISGSEDLGRALADPGVPANARKGVLEDLFGAHLGEQTLRLIRYVVDAERAPETSETVAGLAERARAAANDLEPVGDVVLGHKAAEERLDGYATALLEGIADQRGLGEVEDELFRFLRVVDGSDGLKQALTSRDVPAANRRRLVADLLAAKATSQTAKLAAYATRVGRPRDYQDLLDYLVAKVAAESNRRLAEVRSAVELDESQIRALAGALSGALGHDVEVRVTVDPDVVGGFVATIGDTVVDASARRQLELLRERLALPEVGIGAGPSPHPSNPDNTTGERR